MKDLKKLADECMQELDSIGIKYGEVRCWKINTRAQSRWGLCKKHGNNAFEIQISHRLLADDMDDHATKETIIHELLHTIEGAFGHKGKWKELAWEVNRKLPEYSIKRTTSFKEKYGEEWEPQAAVSMPAKYEITCTRCGKKFPRSKKSKLVKYPNRYLCSYCGGQLKRTK